MCKKILIIDDEESIVKVVEARLQANGFIVFTATDGEQGLKILEAEDPDLILLDIVMPKMDGYTFVRKIKYNNSIRPIPIIMLTARDQMKELFDLEGVKDYIVKPFDAEELIEKINTHISK